MNLKHWRARLGFSQRRAARELGVALSTYQQWESGISRKTGRKIAPPAVVWLAVREIERTNQ